MENHVHLVTVPHNADAMGRMMQRLDSEYARWIHFRHNKMGHLWQGRYHSVALDEEHYWAVMVYVEQNPCRAGLVNLPWQWPWSSAQAHAGEAKPGLLNVVRWAANHSPDSWKCLLEYGLRDGALVQRIRDATLRGWPLGSDDFCVRLESELGLPVRPRTPRKPPKDAEPSEASGTSRQRAGSGTLRRKGDKGL
jgi:putative transposase